MNKSERENIIIDRCKEKGPYFSSPEFSDPPNSIKVSWRLIDIDGNEKYEFKRGERILLDFRVEGVYPYSVLITNKIEVAGYEYLYYEIYDENGKIVEGYPHCFDCDEGLYDIPEGDDVEMFIRLFEGNYVGSIRAIFWAGPINENGKIDCSFCREYKLNKAGKYVIKGYYRNMDKKEIADMIREGKLKKYDKVDLQRLWSGKINLKPIEFKIVEIDK